MLMNKRIPKQLIPIIFSQRLSTTNVLQAGEIRQMKTMKKIMAGREKGSRKWVYNDKDLPKMQPIQKISGTKNQGKESNRRVTVLNKLFMENITSLMATDRFAEAIYGCGLQVTAVKVTPDFNVIHVFWLANGNENDLKTDSILKAMAGPLRHELSKLRLMGEVPRITFVKDRHFSKALEVDILLRQADFGEDFEPTDPTFLMKSKFELQMKLPDDIRQQVIELDQKIGANEYLDIFDDLPEMRHDVLGIDQAAIMRKITGSIGRSKQAWESYAAGNSSELSADDRENSIQAANNSITKLNSEVEMRDTFMKYLEQRQFAKKYTPDRKKSHNYSLNDVDDDFLEEYMDPVPDDDFIEDDNHDIKK